MVVGDQLRDRRLVEQLGVVVPRERDAALLLDAVQGQVELRREVGPRIGDIGAGRVGLAGVVLVDEPHLEERREIEPPRELQRIDDELERRVLMLVGEKRIRLLPCDQRCERVVGAHFAAQC